MRWATVLMVCLFAISSSRSQDVAHTGIPIPHFTEDFLPHSTTMDDNGKVHVSWDFNKTHIAFEISAPTLGYVGLGISPKAYVGGVEKMSESDIVIGWVDDYGKPHISDRFATGNEEPRVDREQDVTLMWGRQNNTHTVIRFVRPREACHFDDVSIKWGPVHLIWAFNDMDPDPTSNTIKYHSYNRGVKVVFLLNPMKAEPYIPSDAESIDVRNRDFEIPQEKFHLECRSLAIPQMENKRHVIKIEPIVDTGRRNQVLSIRLLGCNNHAVTPSVGVSHKCYDAGMPQDWWACTVGLFIWSNTAEPFYLPPNAGLPLGGDGSITMFLLETQYYNSEMKTGMVDSSGLRLTVTSQLREHDAGMMTLGYVPSNTLIIPPYEKAFRLDGHCSKECLKEAISTNPKTDHINVFAVVQHMYTKGFKIRLRHFRDGIEAKPIAEREHYNMSDAAMRWLEEEVTVYSGDNLMNQCFYNTKDDTEVTWSGSSVVNEELCVSMVMYYPKIPLSQCMSAPHAPYLASFAGATLDDSNFATITSPPELKGQDWTVLVKDHIDWSEASTRERFQEFITVPHDWGNYGLCNSGSVKQPSDGKLTRFSEIMSEYPEKSEMMCMTVAGGSPQFSFPAIFLVLWAIGNRCLVQSYI